LQFTLIVTAAMRYHQDNGLRHTLANEISKKSGLQLNYASAIL
jgi:hypothetical protein